MLVIGPEWPGKLATFALSFKSQILITLKFESYTNGKNYHHVNIQATYSYVLHRITIALFGIEFVEVLKYLSVVPVPKIKPSGWNWAQVSAKEKNKRFLIADPDLNAVLHNTIVLNFLSR